MHGANRYAVGRDLRRERGVCLAVVFSLVWMFGGAFAGECTFVRGDIANVGEGAERVVDLNDAVDILAYLLVARSVPECEAAADVNDNGLVELSDYTYLVNFLFAGGPAPPPPFPEPGTDPTPGVGVSPDRDARFRFEVGASAGVPSDVGIAIPVRMVNEVPVTGLTMVLRFDPDQLRVDQIVTEEGTILSRDSAEYIFAEADNTAGMVCISALKDFATPFWFQVASDPEFPPSPEGSLVATLKCGIVVGADKGFAPIAFADALKIRDPSVPPTSPDVLPELHNLVALGPAAVRPVLAAGGGIDIRRGFIRGDANKDDGVDISDAVYLIGHIFLGGPVPPCKDAADVNNDTRLDISDSIFLLNYLFKGGPQPSEPFPQAGVDPSDDGGGSLGCESD
ncbi:MAG: dockerin type I repeat-containing protein [Planctomycetota bacterium]